MLLVVSPRARRDSDIAELWLRAAIDGAAARLRASGMGDVAVAALADLWRDIAARGAAAAAARYRSVAPVAFIRAV